MIVIWKKLVVYKAQKKNGKKRKFAMVMTMM